MYYLNAKVFGSIEATFLRTKFICIIWTQMQMHLTLYGSWGLSLFVLFELRRYTKKWEISSWGLSLFVLFEQHFISQGIIKSSWGLSLFVLFEH